MLLSLVLRPGKQGLRRPQMLPGNGICAVISNHADLMAGTEQYGKHNIV